MVIDSVAALVPRAEIEGEMGDTHVGLQARLMSQAMRKLAGSLSKFDTTCIFINQLREKIGVMFGSPETTPGGRALKFYSSVRLDVRKIENLKDGQEVVGSRTRVKVVKNKVAPPFRQCEFDIMYGKGISKEGSFIDVGVDLEIIKKAGAWFTYEGEQLGQGRENARAFLAEHIDIRDEIEQKVRDAVGLNGFSEEDDAADRGRARPRGRERAPRQGREGGGQGRRVGPVSDADRQGQGKGPTGGKRKDIHERALGLLAVRQRSRRELERRLVHAGFEPEAVDAELERLERVGLIDDEAFARAVVESRVGRRGESRRAVAGKLALAGVDRGLATQVLDDAGIDEQAVADRARDDAERPARRPGAAGRVPTALRLPGPPRLRSRGGSPRGPQSPCGGSRRRLALAVARGRS